MASSTVTRLYFVGKTADLALNGDPEPMLREDVAQELAREGENVYAIDMTIFSSRLKTIKKVSKDAE